MKTSFSQLVTEQRQAKAELETAIEKLFITEKALIEKNPFMQSTPATHGRDAALELVQLVVEQKLEKLTSATGNSTTPVTPSDPTAS